VYRRFTVTVASLYTPPWLPQEGGGASEPSSSARTWGPVAEGTASDASPPSPTKKPSKDPVTGRFVKGGGGNVNGSRHGVTIAVEKMMVDEAGALTRRCIDLAKQGDPTALKLVMDRIAPVRKGRVLPRLRRETGEGSIEALLRAVLDGEITPEEGKSVTSLIEGAAQVAAAQALASIRRRQLELLEKAAKEGTASGVMLVPLLAGLDQWEATATSMQHQLKAKVRE
jgi:hypothetical protein